MPTLSHFSKMMQGLEFGLGREVNLNRWDLFTCVLNSSSFCQFSLLVWQKENHANWSCNDNHLVIWTHMFSYHNKTKAASRVGCRASPSGGINTSESHWILPWSEAIYRRQVSWEITFKLKGIKKLMSSVMLAADRSWRGKCSLLHEQ